MDFLPLALDSGYDSLTAAGSAQIADYNGKSCLKSCDFKSCSVER